MQDAATPKKGQGRRAGKGRGRGDKNVSRAAVSSRQDFLYAGFEYESLEVKLGCWSIRMNKAFSYEACWKVWNKDS